jgi:hypothetical protein
MIVPHVDGPHDDQYHENLLIDYLQYIILLGHSQFFY